MKIVLKVLATLVVVFLIVLVGLAVLIHHRRERLLRLETAAVPAGRTTNYGTGGYRESIRTAGRRVRTYNMHLPTGFSATRKYPLVLVFHGGFGTGGLIERGTRFDEEADARGFIAVYPDGIDESWNDGRDAANADIDDIGFVRQLIASLETRLPIDPKRIYATGASNGGMFVQRLGCELADTLAAIGSDIGPMPTNLLPVCKPARPIAMLGIQGGADPIVPLQGGEVRSFAILGLGRGGEVESAAATMKFWAAANNCNPDPQVAHEPPAVNDGTRVDRYTYAGCVSGAPVVYYIVAGMGHAWPPHPGQRPRITGATSHNINATTAMWNFFRTLSR